MILSRRFLPQIGQSMRFRRSWNASSGCATTQRRPCCASPASEVYLGLPEPATRSPPSCTHWMAATSRPGRRVRRCAGWSTCCRPAATSTPSTPRQSRPGWPIRPARRWRSRCSSRHLDETGDYPQSVGLVGLGHLGHADQWRRHRRGAWRCSACCPSGTRRRAEWWGWR